LSPGGEGSLEATVHGMTEDEGSEIAMKIVEFIDAGEKFDGNGLVYAHILTMYPNRDTI
jgi:hypothetical protein